MKNKLFFTMFCVILVFSIIYIGCPREAEVLFPPEDILLSSADAKAPVIKYHPVSRNYVIGTDTELLPLTVEADKAEKNDVLTYEWYETSGFSASGGDKVGDGKTFTPAISLTAASENIYYARIINTNTEKDGKQTAVVFSSPARIKVTAAPITPRQEYSITNTKYNYVRGLGGTGSFMFRDGAGAGASPEVDVNIIDKYMGPNGIGLNIIRIMVCDEYEKLVTNEVQSHQGPWQDNKKNWFAVIRRINQYGGYVFANPWTSPGYMKYSNRPRGNDGDRSKLMPQYYVAYANHLRGFAQFCVNNNAPVYSVGVLNEPDWGGSADYEGMRMTGDEHRDWFRKVGHFTTQRVKNEDAVVNNLAAPDMEYDPIQGYGGGQWLPFVLVMTADSMGDISGFMRPLYTDKGDYKDREKGGAYYQPDLFGRHYYASSGRWVDHVGAQDTAFNNKPDGDFVPAEEYRQDFFDTQPMGNRRETWMTERHGDIVDGTIMYEWGRYTFDLLNEVDHCIRCNDESAYVHWYSQCWWGLVGDGEWGSKKGEIQTRGRAYAHYARYAKNVWRLGVTKVAGAHNPASDGDTATGSGGIFTGINPTTKTNEKFMATRHMRINPFLDAANEEFINVVIHSGTNNSSSHIGVGSSGEGDVKLNLPEGFVAKSAHAWASWGRSPNQYWQDYPIILANDGKSAIINIPEKFIVSIKFSK